MKLKRLILKSIYTIGKTLGANRNFVSVLCYHSFSNSKDKYAVSLADFKKQLEVIKQYAHFIGMEDLSAKNLRGWNVCLTIDDGYQDAKSIIPIVSSLKIPVTLFVMSESGKVNRKEIDNKHKLLALAQIKELHKLGWTIGCHSATHADLSKLSDADLIREIINSKKSLEKKLGIKINYFAYPKGIFTQKVIEYVKKAGYKMAFSTEVGKFDKNANRLLIPRTVVDKSRSISDFPYFFSETNSLVRKVIDQTRIWKFLSVLIRP